MIKNIVIGVYCSLAVLLMSFSTNSTSKTTIYSKQKPTEVTWKLLGQIDFVKRKNPHYGEVMYPMVNGTLKALQGKKIKASGFIVPIDSKSYALSKNVFAQCFFCGNAGPETIMGIKFKGNTPRLKTDTYVTMEGTFRYNADDIDDWIYHIENAVITHQK
ncbi:hypothetical protein P3875_11625 [Myroides sp. JBRI-B21084]|uniref:hypothetical protein n=1 Tax=Myroides sp. JBRI-B21084 TaxID=3119977 RepID=UPI0026E2D0C4|nr:hypothetical protein [Paenimyroides cloacae]WKW46406.1 hypothetical protein P3875_11625 [Paenimyroides cloacae]